MSKNINSPEQMEIKNSKKSKAWKRIITTIALGIFTACDEVPNNQIIIDPQTWTEQFSFEYHLWSWESEIIDFNISVYKDWNLYKWLINQKDWWLNTKTNIESNSIDGLFNEILRVTDTQQITGNTREKRDKKVRVAKETYKNYILNGKDNNGEKKIKIKYKSE